MPDILSTAVSGLLTFQRSLSTTSHNIANVNTPGYSRQSVEIGTRSPTLIGGSFVGNGAQIDSVSRAYDQFITASLRSSSSDFNRLEKLHSLSSQIDNILADPQGGISPILQEFFASVQDVSDDPASSTARFQLINTAETLVARFNTFDTRLEQLSKNTENDIESSVDEINAIAIAIRDINISLAQNNPASGLTQQSADLLDKRDALLVELSTKIEISVINEQENNVTVLIGNGQTIISGGTSFNLATQPDPADPSNNIITYNGLVAVNDISDSLTGGELGGLLTFRNDVLNPARNSLGRVAIGLADTFNDQHNQGMDLLNNLGANFFSFSQPDSIPNQSNAGTSVVTTTITDVPQLTTEDYMLEYDGANWTLVAENGSSSPVTADASPADTTIVFEGLTVVIDGASTPAAGDSFSIKPTVFGSRSIDVVIDDPNEVAAAVPIRTSTSLQNLGDAEISSGIVTDSSDPNLFNSVTFTFDNPATTFTSSSDVTVGATNYLAGASIPYSANMVVDSNGWQVTLSGNPQANDTMTVEANLNPTGDNRNALALGQLQTTGIFENGLSNYQETYGILVGEVGSVTQSADVNREAQRSLLTQAEDRFFGLAGVNLDEEAADMIRYQQAYEASARVIGTAQALFDSLLSSFR